jgi:hypothetical protein
MPASIPFTSTLNETQFGQTRDAKADVDVVGGATNLTGATIKARDISGSLILSTELMPIYTFFGKRESARPVLYYPRARPLDFGNSLEVAAKTEGTEAAGHCVFLCVPRDEADAEIEGLETRGCPAAIAIDSSFTATANEIIPKATPKQDDDFVIHGAYTTLASAQIRIQGVRGEQWTPDFTPVWAFAGRASSQLNILYWPRPYLIPKGSSISIDFKNVGAEASGKLYLVGQKL